MHHYSNIQYISSVKEALERMQVQFWYFNEKSRPAHLQKHKYEKSRLVVWQGANLLLCKVIMNLRVLISVFWVCMCVDWMLVDCVHSGGMV